MQAATDIFEGELLGSHRARLAYPLVRLFDPAISLDSWLAFARRWSRQSAERGGLMAIRDRRGYLHALFTYRIEHNLRFGKFLRVSDVIMGQLPGASLNRSILDTATRLAGRTGCAAIVIEPAHDTATTAPGAPETASFGYLIEPARSRAS
ncbi:MAG: hypothetical protein EPO23_11680 [Xanthobacteraceae bacterium]|nr:MAG: hypothetical protein EPO23_11680 [Xanthobacteraceae bacterium]